MNKFIASLSVLALSAIATPAFCEDFSLHVSGAGAAVVGQPQESNFRTGIAGSAKLLFPVFSPNLAVGPSVAVMSLESNNDSSRSANVWSFGATARLQGNHSAQVVPYVDLSGSVDKQGSLFRPGLGTSIGLDIATDASHTFSMGPVFGYQHVFDNTYTQATDLLPHKDANVVLFGWSVSFDGAPKPVVKTVSVPVDHVVVRTQLVQVPTPAPAPAPVAPVAPLTVSERVSFDFDSAALSDSAKATLDAVAAKLNANPGYSVVVKGSASSDGNSERNLKLSYLRAVSVVSYLAVHGNVDASRLTPAGVGAVGSPGDTNNRSTDFVMFQLVKN
jgi:outer membrane protein OmpA-like peptidoglycan-associated protein